MRVLPKRAPSRQTATTTAPQRTPRRTNRSEPRLETPSRKTDHRFLQLHNETQGFSHRHPRDNNREKPSTLLVAHHAWTHHPCPMFRIETRNETRSEHRHVTPSRNDNFQKHVPKRNFRHETRGDNRCGIQDEHTSCTTQTRPDFPKRGAKRLPKRSAQRADRRIHLGPRSMCVRSCKACCNNSASKSFYITQTPISPA